MQIQTKFHAILFSKDRADNSGKTLKVRQNEITSKAEVDLLELKIDQRLSFDSHISKICRKASKQLNALKRLGGFLSIPQKKVLAQSFILSNFNYCPAIWHFCSEKNLHKMESVQLRALRFIHNDYHSAYSKLLYKSNMCTLELGRIHSVCTEIYKTINRIGPNYMVSLISHNQQQYSCRRTLNLFVPRVNQSTFGLKSFYYLGTLLWNSLPENIKSATDLNTFKRLIKSWYRPTCRCNFCNFAND